ncbi:MAG: flagellar biosynthetic protein FliO [Thiobacillus sp.]
MSHALLPMLHDLFNRRVRRGRGVESECSPQRPLRTLRLKINTKRWLAGFAALPLSALATTAPATAPAVGAGSLFQVIFGLVVVLGLILGIAWIGRRMGLTKIAGGHALSVVASTSVGTRERVVIVETGHTWLVVGVAPGSVNLLTTMPRAESSPAPLAAPSAGFAARLQSLIEKNRG